MTPAVTHVPGWLAVMALIVFVPLLAGNGIFVWRAYRDGWLPVYRGKSGTLTQATDVYRRAPSAGMVLTPMLVAVETDYFAGVDSTALKAIVYGTATLAFGLALPATSVWLRGTPAWLVPPPLRNRSARLPLTKVEQQRIQLAYKSRA